MNPFVIIDIQFCPATVHSITEIIYVNVFNKSFKHCGENFTSKKIQLKKNPFEIFTPEWKEIETYFVIKIKLDREF